MSAAVRARDASLESHPTFTDLRRTGQGDAVTVYAARETGTGRSVTLKVIDRAAPEFAREALDREATYLALLGTHPAIATLFQTAELPDGRTALVLEYCPDSVDVAVREQRLDPSASVSIAIKIAGALETVHRAGLVHCAVRPQNILLTEFGEPVLSGFMSVFAGADSSVVAVQETTPHTAPELLLGEDPTPATDVYGLASTLYEMLTGKPAFPAYSRESPAAVSLRILSGGARPIAEAGVPLELSDLVLWGLAPDPHDRPPGAAWLAEELSRIERKFGWTRTRMVTGEPRRLRRPARHRLH